MPLSPKFMIRLAAAGLFSTRGCLRAASISSSSAWRGLSE